MNARRGTDGALPPTRVYICSAQAQLKEWPKDTSKCQVRNCGCEDASRGGQGVSYRVSKRFSSCRTNCRYPSFPEDTPHHERAAHRHNVPYRHHATGTTGTDPTRPPRPDAFSGRTSEPLCGADDDSPTAVMPTTQQPHARTSRNPAHRKTTSPTGNKQRRDNYSDQTRLARPIRATTQPRRADHWRTNASEPTSRTGHAPVATHPPHRTGRQPQPSEQTGKTTKTTSDSIGAGYTTGCRSNCCRTTGRQ